jgi:hypothetical protein
MSSWTAGFSLTVSPPQATELTGTHTEGAATQPPNLKTEHISPTFMGKMQHTSLTIVSKHTQATENANH